MRRRVRVDAQILSVTHEQYKEMLAVAALAMNDAREGDEFALAPADLDADYTEAERDALNVHLAVCSECRRELAALRNTAAMLAYTVPEAAPSDDLRERILARVRVDIESAEKQKSDAYAPESSEASEHAGASNVVTLAAGKPRPLVEASAGETKGEVIPHPRANAAIKSPAGWFWKIGLLAACVALAVCIAALFALWQRNKSLQTQLAAISDEQQKTRDELTRTRSELAFFTSPDARMMQLTGTGVAPQAQARLVYDKQTGRALLYVSNLPPAPAGKAYQIWYIAGGTPLPGKVFKTDAHGNATMRDNIPPEGLNASLVAVTLEPESGASSPTGEKYLLSPAS
jgi:anti-sigma-K factor RskA